MKKLQFIKAVALYGAIITITGCGSSSPVVSQKDGKLSQPTQEVPKAAPTGVPTSTPNGSSEKPGSTNQACVSIDKPIGFKASGIYKDLFNIQGGDVPAQYQRITTPYTGSVQLIENGSIGRYSTLPGRPLGSISLNILPVAGAISAADAGATEGPVDAVGIINVSAEYRKKIMYDAGVIQPGQPSQQGQPNSTTPCVNGVSFSLGIGNGQRLGGFSDSTLYGGFVILNSTIGPIILNF